MLGGPSVGNMQEMSESFEPLYVLNSVKPGHFSRGRRDMRLGYNKLLIAHFVSMRVETT